LFFRIDRTRLWPRVTRRRLIAIADAIGGKAVDWVKNIADEDCRGAE